MRAGSETEATAADSPQALFAAAGATATRATVALTDPGPQPAGATTAIVSTPGEALQLEEARRIRVFLVFAALLSSFAGLALPFMNGDPLATKIHIAGCAVTTVGSLAILWYVRDPANYRPWLSTLFGVFAVATVDAAFYFWGVNSAVAFVIPLGVYFFGLGQSFTGALFIQLLAMIPHAVLSVLQMTHTIEDVGIVPSFTNDLPRSVAILLLIQFVFLASFVMARGLRRSTLDILEQLDGAVRGNAQREALLNEARQELAVAQRVGGPGRFTDQELGSFKLGHVIGRGAMGEVYEATHRDTGQLAAVKVLGREALRNPDMVSRFLREVQIAASLTVENVVRVLEAPDPDDSLPYLAMERLRGETLADILRAEPRMRLAEVVDMLRALARGIGAAHEAGIVHRDLKPRNVFLHAPDGAATWKILDFGVSKLAAHDGTLTRGNVIGTPAYMAPEQARGDAVDHRADIYALGCIAYRALTGRPAFSGRDVPSILRSVVYDSPPRPTALADLPAHVELVLAIAMAKLAADRFDTATALSDALTAASTGDLAPELVAHGRDLVAKRPWGEQDARR